MMAAVHKSLMAQLVDVADTVELTGAIAGLDVFVDITGATATATRDKILGIKSVDTGPGGATITAPVIWCLISTNTSATARLAIIEGACACTGAPRVLRGAVPRVWVVDTSSSLLAIIACCHVPSLQPS